MNHGLICSNCFVHVFPLFFAYAMFRSNSSLCSKFQFYDPLCAFAKNATVLAMCLMHYTGKIELGQALVYIYIYIFFTSIYDIMSFVSSAWLMPMFAPGAIMASRNRGESCLLLGFAALVDIQAPRQNINYQRNVFNLHIGS